MDVDLGHRLLKVVDVRRADLTHIVGVTRDEVGELGVECEGGRLGSADPRYLVDGIGEPLQSGLPTSVAAPLSLYSLSRIKVLIFPASFRAGWSFKKINQNGRK